MTRSTRVAAALTILGAAFFVAGLMINAPAAWRAYLVATMAMLTVSLGALALVMIAHVSDATWFVVLRRASETVASTTWLVVVLMLPLVFGLGSLYPWLHPERLDPTARTLVLSKTAYLNLPFFLARAVVYFTTWIVLTAWAMRWSRRQDRGEPGSAWGVSAAGLILLGFTVTFAAFDWLMSLTPAWFSTIYGVRVFSGGLVSALALVAVLLPTTRLPVRRDHAQTLATLLIACIVFWFYIAFSQLLVIWIGNEPVEISWYLARAHGVPLGVGILLLGGHFVVPFLLLLQRRVKCSLRAMAWLGAWLLAMHYVDTWWLVMPGSDPAGMPSHWMDLPALFAVAGAAWLLASWQWRRHPVVPVGDPQLAASLAYEEP